MRNHRQQIGRGANGAGRTGGDNRPLDASVLPFFAPPFQQRIAPRGRVHFAELIQLRRPEAQNNIQQGDNMLPIFGQAFRGQLIKPVKPCLFILRLVKKTLQIMHQRR